MLPSHIQKKDEHEIMVYLGKLYRSSKLKNSRYSMYEAHEHETSYMNLEVAYEFDLILEYMEPIERTIIINDYLLPKLDEWWKKQYSKCVYMEYKRSAITTFLHCLYT